MLEIAALKPIEKLDSYVIKFAKKVRHSMAEHFEKQYEDFQIKFMPQFIGSIYESRPVIDRYLQLNLPTRNSDIDEGDLGMVLEKKFAAEHPHFLIIAPISINHDYKEEEKGKVIEFITSYRLVFNSIHRDTLNHFYYTIFHALDNDEKRWYLLDKADFSDYKIGNITYNCMSIKLKINHIIQL